MQRILFTYCKILFTIKTLNLNVKVGQNIKIVLKLKTKAINRKEINATTFSFDTGTINLVVVITRFKNILIVLDASIKLACWQSTSWDLLAYVLKFEMWLTCAGRILGRYKDIASQCFIRESVVAWKASTWIRSTSQTLW